MKTHGPDTQTRAQMTQTCYVTCCVTCCVMLRAVLRAVLCYVLRAVLCYVAQFMVVIFLVLVRPCGAFPFLLTNDHLTKTGSGQTRGQKLTEKRRDFSRQVCGVFGSLFAFKSMKAKKEVRTVPTHTETHAHIIR